MTEELISEAWLSASGFKWHQHDRQPEKHWLLWLGSAVGRHTSFEDIGIEVTTMQFKNSSGDTVGDDAWFVWFRSDTAHRYSRFVHVRHMRYQHELIKLVEAVSGQPWAPENHLYGSALLPKHAAEVRQREQDLDHRIRSWHPHNDIEKDDSRGRALPNHFQDSVKNGTSK
ncbi:hypothetical protein LJR231_001547 [Phyllobacterium sp. LjRoot231]|uniref:hypothetical protein n=1 Tax=Phyllobacterium sp. LjRoot231 TaxID=3342289 RepID=UPI003ECF2A7A